MPSLNGMNIMDKYVPDSLALGRFCWSSRMDSTPSIANYHSDCRICAKKRKIYWLRENVRAIMMTSICLSLTWRPIQWTFSPWNHTMWMTTRQIRLDSMEFPWCTTNLSPDIAPAKRTKSCNDITQTKLWTANMTYPQHEQRTWFAFLNGRLDRW